MKPAESPGLHFSLRARLVLIIFVIITFIQIAEIVTALSREVADLDHQIVTSGTILAQGLASACSELMEGENPERFTDAIARVARAVDVLEVSIANADGIVIGHDDPTRIGELFPEEASNLFRLPRSKPGFSGLFRGYTDYFTSAPIVRGTTVIGFVSISFRSRTVSERAVDLIVSAAGLGLLWLFVGAVAGTLYVRRITRPLAALTLAATAISEDRPEEARIEEPTVRDEVGLLQSSFVRLLSALRRAQASNDQLLAEQQNLNVRLQERVEAVTADLRATTTYLRAVLQCMEEGVITCDEQDVIVQANEGAFRQLRDLGEPSPGSSIASVIPDGEALAEAVRKSRESDTKAHVELVRSPDRASRPAGAPAGTPVEMAQRTVAFRTYPLRAQDGTPFGTVTTVWDETEERRVEAQLRRHDRLISLGTIAAGLAHELGTYMHTINGFSSIVMKGMPPDSPLRADVVTIHEDNAKAVAVLERFLQFARLEQTAYTPVAVDWLIGEALDICAFRIRSGGVTIVDERGLKETTVSCDPRLIEQVFVNLVLNAVDAMLDRADKQLVVSSRRKDDEHVEIEFRDTGIGISPEHCERIFDPFFTTKAATGTGLGLSIAHQIIDRHQGTISVHSRLGLGTTFRVVLRIGGPGGGADVQG